MSQRPLAIDAMGGDKAPAAIVGGIRFALKFNPDLRFVLFGDEPQLKPLLQKFKLSEEQCRIVHTPDYISNSEKPSMALRKGKNSSMRLAIDSVKAGECSAVVSAGNTGALMAMSKLVYKTLPGIHRPAIIAFFPAIDHKIVMLDLGANIQCGARELIQFAYMGDAFAKSVLGLKHPRVAILNVGSEEEKGHEELKIAAAALREPHCPLNFTGYIEGHDIVDGKVDVVVSDGFSGNVALKTAEGTGKLIRHMIKETMQKSIWAKVGFLLATPALVALKRKLDPRSYNGAMFIGLNGITVKSHGGADAKSFANAIDVAVKLVEQDINTRITDELTQTGLAVAATEPAIPQPDFVPESIN
jgi:glycerol-3-phosphate acyltransferase PlsX